MIIVNADDWGRSVAETDAALACFRAGRVTSVSAMVFMDDSDRAAQLARAQGVDVGLHLNFSQPYTRGPAAVATAQARIVRFMSRSKYAQLLYHPGLRGVFRQVYQDQAREFVRLYGQEPSHVDGHQHRHLCANLLLQPVIPEGQKVRRNFTFMPGEKSRLNRAYRSWVDARLARRYQLTDYLFNLSQHLDRQRLARVLSLAATASVELETHPIHESEQALLLSDTYRELLEDVPAVSYAAFSA